MEVPPCLCRWAADLIRCPTCQPALTSSSLLAYHSAVGLGRTTPGRSTSAPSTRRWVSTLMCIVCTRLLGPFRSLQPHLGLHRQAITCLSTALSGEPWWQMGLRTLILV